MGESGVQLSLPQMVDLALGSPEVGAVNFKILHSLLHVLIQQVDLLGCKVEFKGDTSETVQMLMQKTPQAPGIILTEYIVTPENEQHRVIYKKARYKKLDTKGGKDEGLFEQELQVVERSREPQQQTRSKQQTEPRQSTDLKQQAEPKQQAESKQGTVPKQQADQVSWAESVQTVVVVETGSEISTPHTSVAISKVTLANLERELNNLREEVDELRGLPTSMGLIETIRTRQDTDVATSTLGDMFQFMAITKRFEALEEGIHRVAAIVEELAQERETGDTGQLQKRNQEMYDKILGMQEAIEKLMAEKATRQQHMDTLLDQIELLKTANQADTCAANRKKFVSHDQFDAACDDLSRNIEEALNKLLEQERLWQQALGDIQGEIGTKLDKLELLPLQDFVQNKLQMLQERLKALAALKKDTEAAGVKSKYLRNVNCISCNNDVVIRKEMHPSLMAPGPKLPPTKSIGPYLAFELDQLRKEQKISHGRNMRHFEDAVNFKKQPDSHHLCTRYCGGSHTTTTPQQRVARVGHFLLQWGDEKQNQVVRESQQGVVQEDKQPMVVSGDVMASRRSHTKLYPAKRSQKV